MREHIYKAKRLDNGKWVEGYYLCNSLKNNAMENDYEKHLIGSIEKETQTNTIKTTFYEVDPNTLSQHTNLKDKNGKMIFENDIIEFANGARYEVIFEDYMFKISNETHREGLFESEFDSIEVIGNIFDNKELLGGI